jgi:hypothetical protein
MSEEDGAEDGADINVLNFVGKTITDLDVTSSDYVVFHFDDGTKAALEVVSAGPLHNIAEGKIMPTSPKRKTRRSSEMVDSTETI